MSTREWTNEVSTTRTKDTVSDYLWLFSKWITKSFREKFDIGPIFINWAVCLLCKDFIRSRNRHDFRSCKCWKVSVDGWSWYTRRVWELDDYVNVIELFDK